jgi:hypothetical protein
MVRTTKKTVVLLSGDNPQIRKGDGDGPVQAYIAALPGWKRDVGAHLDALVMQAVPNVSKAVKWNSPFYGIEGQGWFLSLHAFKRYIKLAFFRGTSLQPLPPGDSKSPETRYLDIHEGDSLDEALLTGWIKQASQLPGFLTPNADLIPPLPVGQLQGKSMEPSERIDHLIAELTDWRGRTLAHVRKLILAADSQITEEWKWMGSPVWERDGIIAVGNAHKDKVKLTFSHGASLPDPDKLFNNGLNGKVWRAIDILENDQIPEDALQTLVRAAIAYNQDKPKKPKSVRAAPKA